MEHDRCRLAQARRAFLGSIGLSARHWIWPKTENSSPLSAKQSSDPTNFARDVEKETTIKYLAYGSNLSRETFLGVRGIRPISHMNVCVPTLRMTFDLPGIPYQEPCFANTALRHDSSPDSKDIANDIPSREQNSASSGSAKESLMAPAYHKDNWHKPLVGVLYELTQKDFAHVIATEGGGASYQDVIVTCYPLDDESPKVPMHPTTAPVKGHTLFAPAEAPPPPPSPPPIAKSSKAEISRSNGRPFVRPDPSYAQPSARYLKLITDGAAEHALPQEYRDYLDQIRPYRATTVRQRAGQAIFLAIWLPVMTVLVALQSMFADKDGKSPEWMVQLLLLLFRGLWMSYDGGFKLVFGDGERTIGE